MTHKEDYSSEFDIYLSDILDRLREKYDYASVNRMMIKVKFAYRTTETDENGFSYYITRYEEIPNSEIEDCMKSKTLPKKIKDLL